MLRNRIHRKDLVLPALVILLVLVVARGAKDEGVVSGQEDEGGGAVSF